MSFGNPIGSTSGPSSGFNFGAVSANNSTGNPQLHRMKEFNFDSDVEVDDKDVDDNEHEIVDEIEVDSDDFDDVDDVSGVPVTRFEDAPIPAGGVDSWRATSRILKFKLNPNGIDGIGFISQDPHSEKSIKVYPQETKIYTAKAPFFTDSVLYIDFVSNLYSIYEALGEERNYTVPTIGLIKRDAQRAQNEVLNKAFRMVASEVESYAEALRSAGEDETSIFELEECLNIINCLKALHFSSEEEFQELISVWINKADPQPDLELTESIMSSTKPYTHPLFWKFIKTLTIRGLYTNASNSLKQSGYEELQDTDVSLFNLISDCISLLESYPKNSTIDVFKQWRITATKAASNAAIRNESNIELTSNIRSVLNIISGNRQEIVGSCGSWYEVIIALIHYELPTNELYEEYFNLAILNKSPNDLVIWESACVNIFEGKFLTMLRSIGSFNVTIAAYISALCEAKGLLKNYSLEDDPKSKAIFDQDLFSNEKFSSRLLYSHALDCLSISKLVPVGIGILATSKHPLARSVIAEYLPKYQFKNNDDLEWALTICASLKLPQIANAIYRIAGQNSLSDGFFLEALVYFARAGENGIAKYHCWNIVENSLLLGKAVDDVVVNSIVSDISGIDGTETRSLSPQIRQLLAPYAVLYKFWQLKESGDLKASFDKLISLLKFTYLPVKLLGVLLSQLLPFLAFNIPSRVITSKDMITLIKILDDFDNRYDCDQKKDKSMLKECDEFYKYYVKNCLESKTNSWVNVFAEQQIKCPKDIQELFADLRKRISFAIGKCFLFE